MPHNKPPGGTNPRILRRNIQSPSDHFDVPTVNVPPLPPPEHARALPSEKTSPGKHIELEEDTDRRVAAAVAPRRRTGNTGRHRAATPVSVPRVVAPLPQPVPLPAPPPTNATATMAAPSTSRLAAQLGKLLKRKREAIGLSLSHCSGLAGISAVDIAEYEAGAKTPYDHAMVLARVLGLSPTELPGFRSSSESPVKGAIASAMTGLKETMRLVYHGVGDRFEGPVDAVAGVTEFSVEIGDQHIPEYPRGMLLAFMRDKSAPIAASFAPGIVMAHHVGSRMMAMRRIQEDLLVGLAADIPSFHLDRKAWEIVGRLVMAFQPPT